MRIANNAGTRGEARRQERMVDAKPVAAMAVPGELPPIRIAMPPQVAETDRIHAVHETRGHIDRPRLVDVGAAGVEVADRQRISGRASAERIDQRLPVRHLLLQIRHVNTGQPQHAEIDIDQPPRLVHAHAHRPAFDEPPPRRDQHAGTLRRRHQLRHMAIARCHQRGPQSLGRIAAAIFRQDQHIGIMPRDRGHDADQP
jgi:hypothetical protein